MLPLLIGSWQPVLMLYAAPPAQVPFVKSATLETVPHVRPVAHGQVPHVRPSTVPVLASVCWVKPKAGHATSPGCEMHPTNAAPVGGAHAPVEQPPPSCVGPSHVAPALN